MIQMVARHANAAGLLQGKSLFRLTQRISDWTLNSLMRRPQEHQDDGFRARWQFETSGEIGVICARPIVDSMPATSAVSFDESSEPAGNGGGICSHRGLAEFPRQV